VRSGKNWARGAKNAKGRTLRLDESAGTKVLEDLEGDAKMSVRTTRGVTLLEARVRKERLLRLDWSRVGSR